MAYRGDTTDPLENMINRQRGTRKIVILLALLWIVPALFQNDFSVFTSVFDNVRPQPSAPGAAPSTSVAPGASPGTKMSALALERLLRSAPASNRAPRDVRCTPGVSGWDYVCTYQDGPHFQTRLKIGVRVSANAIVQASAPHPFDRPLATP